MGKSTISMAIFNSYVSLKSNQPTSCHFVAVPGATDHPERLQPMPFLPIPKSSINQWMVYKHLGLSENVGYIPNEIAIFHRDNDH